MLNFPVRPAHSGETAAVPENLGQPGIDFGLVVTLVFDDLFLNNRIGFGDQRGGRFLVCVIERIGDRSQPIQTVDKFDVGELEFLLRGGAQHSSRGGMGRTQCAQRIEDDGDIDDLLHDCCWNRGEPSERRREHRQGRKTHSGRNALDRDQASALCDQDGFAHAIDPVG